METVQQNGRFTLYFSKFHSNIYSILFVQNRLKKSKYFLEKPGQYKILQPWTADKFTQENIHIYYPNVWFFIYDFCPQNLFGTERMNYSMKVAERRE